MAIKNIHIHSIFIYPIKSIGGIELEISEVNERGLKYDRQWMLVDSESNFVTQREIPLMAKIGANDDSENFRFYIKDKKETELQIPKSPKLGNSCQVKIWKDKLKAYEVNSEFSQWISEHTSVNLKLVATGHDSKREKFVHRLKKSFPINFPDGYPILVLSRATVKMLNDRLTSPVPIDRFRPNIVLEGLEPHMEDEMKNFNINGCSFAMVKPCARCPIIMTDQKTGIRYPEPLKTLSTYRNRNNQVYFGMNAVVLEGGVIGRGDGVRSEDSRMRDGKMV